MILLPLVLFSTLSCEAAQPTSQYKYTAEQLKALKPPLVAQLHSTMPKSPCLRDPFSPTPKKKKLIKFLAVPHNSPEVHTTKPALPVEEIVLVFEKFDTGKK